MTIPTGPAGRRGLVALGLLLSLAAAWIVVRGVDLQQTGAIVAAADPRFLAAALTVLAVQVIVRAARWGTLLPVGPRGRTSVRRIVPVTLVGYLGNAALPARLGEVIRSVVLAGREGLQTSVTFGSAVLERVLDTLVVAVLGGLAALAIGVDAWVLQVALVAIAVALGALAALAVAPRALARVGFAAIGDVVEALRRVAHGATAQRPTVIAAAIVLTIAAWLLDAALYWLVGRSLGIGLNPAGAMLVSAVAVLSTAVPSAPGYLGTFELAAVAAAAAIGIDRETGLALALVAHAVAVVPLSVGGATAAIVMGVSLRRPALAA